MFIISDLKFRELLLSVENGEQFISTVVPSPNCPPKLSPQAHNEPSDFRAILCLLLKLRPSQYQRLSEQEKVYHL